MRRVSKLSLATAYLEERLADGPLLSAILKEEAAELGISASALYRAANDLGVTSHNVGGWRMTTKWELPNVNLTEHNLRGHND